MEIRINNDIVATFENLDDEFAYKDGMIYKMCISNKSYCCGGCLGRFKVILDENGEVLKLLYPLMGGGEYQILDRSKIEEYRKIIHTFDKYFG